MTQSILLVEDEPGMVLALTDLLEGEGYAVTAAADGDSGFDLARAGKFDLLLLDVMLPGKSGFELCRELRRMGNTAPILMLTARGQLVDKVKGLGLGADDYLAKPFEPLELLARIQALLRRSSMSSAPEPAPTFSFGSVNVDFRSAEVRKGGVPVELSAREFRLLRYFIEHQGATISRPHLLVDVWGYGAETLTRTIDVHVGILRQKLEEDPKRPRHFLTVRGLGYKFLA